MFSFLSSFWRRLVHDLGLRTDSRRSFELDEEWIRPLQDLALRDRRPTEAVVSDLLSFAIIHRQTAGENLGRWKALSPREMEVVALVCCGYANREIAERLVISPETVKAHVRTAVRKFGVRTKAQLLEDLSDWDFSAWDNS
jgi:LuxR family transcriptional regulator, regulator of acetate metabolism